MQPVMVALWSTLALFALPLLAILGTRGWSFATKVIYGASLASCSVLVFTAWILGYLGSAHIFA
jgi:hypothetical protein